MVPGGLPVAAAVLIANRGVVTLRYDKRGVGGSDGESVVHVIKKYGPWFEKLICSFWQQNVVKYIISIWENIY